MNETLYFILSLMAGLALGLLFFGGLWLTVRKTVTARIPALWILGSFIFRTGIALSGFYFVTRGNWQRLFVCLFGFIAARYIILRFTRANDEKQAQLKKEAAHGA